MDRDGKGKAPIIVEENLLSKRRKMEKKKNNRKLHPEEKTGKMGERMEILVC